MTDSASGWLRVSTADTTVSFSGMPINITHLGLSTITVTAQDSFGESTSATFTINVSSQPLTLSTATVNHKISGGQEFSYEIAFSNPNNSMLEYTITVTGPAPGWLTVSTDDTTVSFSGTPTTAEHLGLSTITVTAQDSFGESTSTAFTINVSSQPLTLSTATVNHEISGRQEFSYDIAFSNPNNSILGYMITIPEPAFGWLRVSTADTTVSFSGMPINITHLGLSTITVTAQDSFDESITATFTINVSSQPLTLTTETTNREIFVNQPFSYKVAFSNPNNSILGYMITIPMASRWLRVSTADTTVSFSGTPTTTEHLGLSTITVTAQDAFGESASTTFTINVLNQTPILHNRPEAQTVGVNGEFSYLIPADIFRDPENGTLRYTITITEPAPSWLSFSSTDLTTYLTGTPPDDTQSGSARLR